MRSDPLWGYCLNDLPVLSLTRDIGGIDLFKPTVDRYKVARRQDLDVDDRLNAMKDVVCMNLSGNDLFTNVGDLWQNGLVDDS